MTTIVERDSSSSTVLVIFVVLLLLLAGGGLGFAYKGAFGEKPTVIENNKTVENKTVVMPVEAPPAAPANAPESPKPYQQPTR